MSFEEIAFTLLKNVWEKFIIQASYFEGDEGSGGDGEDVIIFDVADGEDFVDHEQEGFIQDIEDSHEKTVNFFAFIVLLDSFR